MPGEEDDDNIENGEDKEPERARAEKFKYLIDTKKGKDTHGERICPQFFLEEVDDEESFDDAVTE